MSRFTELKSIPSAHIWRTGVPFKALCFGLSAAPQVFTRVLAPLAKIAHMAGVRILLYLDDWLILTKSKKNSEGKEICDRRSPRTGHKCEFGEILTRPLSMLTYLGMALNSTAFWDSPAVKRVINFYQLRLDQASRTRVLPREFIPGARLRIRPIQYILHYSWDRTNHSDKTKIQFHSLSY